MTLRPSGVISALWMVPGTARLETICLEFIRLPPGVVFYPLAVQSLRMDDTAAHTGRSYGVVSFRIDGPPSLQPTTSSTQRACRLVSSGSGLR